MTTSTGTEISLDDRAEHGFDRLISSPTTAVAGRLTTEPDDAVTPRPRGHWGVIVTAVLTAVVIGGIGVLALASTRGEAAEPATSVVTAVTGMEIADLVQAGWSDTEAAGTASCPDPTTQTPGTTVQCTAEYDGAAITFTAVLGDVTAGDARISIESWTSQTAG